MTRRTLKSIGATFAVAALATASLALGAGAASAADPLDTCILGSGVFDTIETTGAGWDGVCENDSTVEEGATAMKSDALDTFGQIWFDHGGPLQVLIGAPASDVTITNNPNDIVYEFTDFGVDVGAGDLVDVEVTRTFTGTFVTWEVNVFDSDDHSPRPDVVLGFTGAFGSDLRTHYTLSPDGIIVNGDLSDPTLIIQYTTGGAVNLTAPVDLNDTFALDFSGGISLTLAMVDFDCNNAGAALAYAQSILPTLSSHVGESLSVGTGTPCITTPSPVHLPAGQPFDYAVPFTVVPGSHDLADGGQVFATAPVFATAVATDNGVADTMPGVHFTGVAPASGTYDVLLVVNTQADEFREVLSFTFIIDPPMLAATGADATPMLWAGFGLALLGALFVLGATRRASRR